MTVRDLLFFAIAYVTVSTAIAWAVLTRCASAMHRRAGDENVSNSINHGEEK